MEEQLAILAERVKQLEAENAETQSQPSTSHGESMNLSGAKSLFKVKPDPFTHDGKSNWSAWLRKFETIAHLNEWNDELKLKVLPAFLKGSVTEDAFYSLPATDRANWPTTVSSLAKKFNPVEAREAHVAKLRACVRMEGEDLTTLMNKIVKLVELAFPDDPVAIKDRTAKDFFISSLEPISLREKVLDHMPTTVDAALAASLRFETNRESLHNRRGGKGMAAVLTTKQLESKSSSAGAPTQAPPWAKEMETSLVKSIQELTKRVERMENHQKQEITTYSYCKKRGHKEISCWKKQTDEKIPFLNAPRFPGNADRAGSQK